MVTPKPRGLIEEALLRKWIDSRDHFLSGPTCSPSRGYMVDVGWFAVSSVDGGLMVVSATPFLRIWPPHAHTGSFSLTSRPVNQGQGNRMGIISCINVCGKVFLGSPKAARGSDESLYSFVYLPFLPLNPFGSSSTWDIFPKYTSFKCFPLLIHV